MNDVSGRQIQNRAWLCLAGAVLISAMGCNNPGTESSQRQAGQVASDPETVLDELTYKSPQLRELIDEARQAVEQGELDNGIGKCTSVLSVLRPARSDYNGSDVVKALSSEVFQLRGSAFLAKGFPLIAIADFDDAIRFGGDELNEKTYVLRARAESKLKRWSQAVDDCGSSIRLNPDNGEAFLVRGQALEAMGQASWAEESFQEAKRLGVDFQRSFKPPIGSAPAFLVEAKGNIEAGVPGVAIEILEKAILEGNDSWETSGMLAQAQFELREFSDAVTTSTRAIEWDPQFADAYRIRGLSYLKTGKFDETITDSKAAIALDPSLSDEMETALSEARRLGGVDPIFRTEVVSRLRESLAAEVEAAYSPGQPERWLMDLISKRRSSDQIEQFKSLLASTPDSEFNSLGWLADFLMLDYQLPAVVEIRNYLGRTSPDVSTLEKRLWESVKSPIAAASSGVNVFPDLAAYSIEYGYLSLLQKSIDTEIGRIKFDHVYRSIERENSDCLKVILPHADLLGRETSKLLKHCIEYDRKDHAMLIVDQYQSSLTWDVIQFLDMDEI